MVLVKILKRRDAASVLVAVVIAMIISQPLTSTTIRLASNIAGVDNGAQGGYAPSGADWQTEYLFPVVWAIVQILVLEVVCWVYIGVVAVLRRAKK